MSGPAPKHPSVRARRNNAKKDFRTLATGANGRLQRDKVPRFPLAPDVLLVAEMEHNQDLAASLQSRIEATKNGNSKARLRRELNKAELRITQLALQIDQLRDAELELWEDCWSMPQSVLWEETASERAVALYCRLQVKAEQGVYAAVKETRMLADRLGLNPLALLRLRVEIEAAAAAEDQGKRRRAEDPVAQPKPDDGEDPRGVLGFV